MSSSLNPAALEPLNTAALPAHWRGGVDRAAIDRAIARALDTVDRNLAHFGDAFPRPSSTHGVYAAMGWPPAGHAFTDMHDWGDMLVHAGFAEPVMDMERITLTFATPERLLQELRELGCNLHPDRFGALRGRCWRERLHAALVEHLADPAQDGQLALTFEIIYGHAFKPAPRLKMSASSAVSLQDMRAMLATGTGRSTG